MFFLADDTFMCGGVIELPNVVSNLVHLAYMAIRIGIPIILLIVGMVDLGKAVVAQKEDEIKKAQGLLIKKVIAAVIVFLLFTLIRYAIGLVTPKDDAATKNMWNCIEELLDGKDGTTETTNNTNSEG